MNIIHKNIFLLLFLLVLSNCGFKVLHQNAGNNFNIKEVYSSGDKKINYKIKNNLIVSSTKGNANLLNLNLNTKKKKTVKEKNIKNEITKYEININVDISFNINNENEEKTFNLSKSGDYIVAENYSTTLNNENKLIKSLIDDLSEKILEKINLILNDI